MRRDGKSATNIPETTPGGRALKFYSTVRIEVRKGEQIEGEVKDEPVGHIVRCIIKKNRCAPPFRKAEFTVLYGVGVDIIDEIANVAVEEGIITRGGAWFSYNPPDYTPIKGQPFKKWQGIDRLKEELRQDPVFYKTIHGMIMDKVLAGVGVEAPSDLSDTEVEAILEGKSEEEIDEILAQEE